METKYCPKCGAMMQLRTNRKNGNKFWGCSNYHPGQVNSCNHIESYRYEKQVIEKKCLDANTFKPSAYQLAIKDAFLNTHDNLQVEATAGSGKTTTIAWLMNYVPANMNTVVISFAKKAADAIFQKIPAGIESGTNHSIGLKSFPYKSVRIEKNKTQNAVKDYFNNLPGRYDPDTLDDMLNHSASIVKMISLIKNTFTPPDDKTDLESLASRYHVEYDLEYADWFFSAVEEIFYNTLENKIEIDLDDMIFIPAFDILPKQYDLVVVDECQDSNNCQIEFFQRMLKPGGRIIFVGDTNQSIYAFRGGDCNMTETIRSRFETKMLSLPVTFRNSRAIVEFVNANFPDIEHIAHDNAPEGIVNDSLPFETFLDIVQEDDLVLCRNNAPLVKPAFELIRAGRKAVILGRDIGEQLKTKIDKIVKKLKVKNVDELLNGLDEYLITETRKLERTNNLHGIDALNDTMDTIRALADDTYLLEDLYAKIDTIFSEDAHGVTFSTIHKAKGLEARSAFVLADYLMPSKCAKTDEELRQERNMKFVAYTRGIENLYIVNDKNQK